LAVIRLKPKFWSTLLQLHYGRESHGQPGGPSRLDPWFAALAFLIPVLSSLPLLGTDLIAGDHTEFVLGSLTLGIVQFPGYPLYLMFTKLLSLLIPHTSDIWRINFISLLYGSLATLLVFLTGRRLRFTPLISLASACFFFFSPFFWQASLLSTYYTFHQLLLTTMLFLTLGIFGPIPGNQKRFRFLFWAALCGLTGGQHPDLLPWAITAFVLGISIGLPRHRAKGSDYSLVFISALVGVILPYIYLPLRVSSPNAFVNLDVVASHVGVLSTFSLTKLTAWLIHYTSEGLHFFFSAHTFHTAVIQLSNNLKAFFYAYPFFPLVVVALGLLFNLRDVFIRQSRRGSTTSGSTGRIFIALLPLLALVGGALLLPGGSLSTQLSLSLACAYWSLKGLEYCYQTLGHSDEILAKAIRLRPTWFGLLIIVLVPILTCTHNYSSFQKQTRHAQSPESSIQRTTQLLKELPAHAILIFPNTSSSLISKYVQQRLAVRPDIALVPFSLQWKKKQLAPPSLLHLFSQKPATRHSNKMKFVHLWIQGLSEKITYGHHAFLMFSPMLPSPTLEYIAQSFTLSEARSPVSEWKRPDQQHYQSVYRIRRQSIPPKPKHRRFAKTYINDFEDELRLVSAQLQRPLKRPGKFSVINISLQWQVLQNLDYEKLLVQFWITPAGRQQSIRMSDGKKRLWKETRMLGRGMILNRLRPRATFKENYQLLVPTDLPSGRYSVHLTAIDKTSNQSLSAGEHGGEQVYFTSACEFWVADSGVETGVSTP
jgi:Protein O-mannosyl-transferase TMEM260-like